MPSIHSVARIQHLKQERKQYKMNNQITLKQLLLVSTDIENLDVYLKDVNAMDITRIIYDHTKDFRTDTLLDYLDYIVESVDKDWNVTIKGAKII